MKKAVLFITLTAIFIAVFLPLGAFALAEEPQETVAVSTETEVILDEETSLENFFNRYIVPIIGGTAASAIGIGLAIAIPFIKKTNNLKQLTTAYRLTKAERDELKEQKSIDINALMKQVTVAIATETISKIGDIVKKEMDKRQDQTTDILTTVNTLSAQVANLVSAATITWGNVDGVAQLLAKSPTAATLNKLAEENTALKNALRKQEGITDEDILKIAERI